MEINLNRHLWHLTGRFNDFVTPALNTGRSYGDAVPSEDVVIARKLLRLDDTTTDYYIIGAMASLISFRPQAGADTSALFRHRTLSIIPTSVMGADVHPPGAQPPSFLHRPTALPAAHRWYVTKTGSDKLEISTDHGYRQEVPFRFVNGIVYLDWPSEVGFDAAFAPAAGVWDIGSQVIFNVAPSGYPYKFVADAAKESFQLVRFMSTQGTLTAFHSAQSSLQKVGALAAAVVQWSVTANP